MNTLHINLTMKQFKQHNAILEAFRALGFIRIETSHTGNTWIEVCQAMAYDADLIATLKSLGFDVAIVPIGNNPSDNERRERIKGRNWGAQRD